MYLPHAIVRRTEIRLSTIPEMSLKVIYYCF